MHQDSNMECLARLSHLGTMPVDEFLAEYWQKKPLLIRNAFPHFKPSMSPEELAGFALEEDIRSRLVIENPDTHQWKMILGPLDESTFSTLPDSHWTLLVQNTDSLNLGVNTLLKAFSFIPQWRLEDIMISYASPGGGVGPHFDYYDVFLLQASGKRRWKLGQKCSASSPLLPNHDMKILSEFEVSDEYLVAPGDLLYIPPQIAHWGVAENACMTYSIGFRAPSHSEILLDATQEIASALPEDLRYSDTNLTTQECSGEIAEQVIESLAQVFESYGKDKSKLATWFGQYMTRVDDDEGLLDENINIQDLKAGRAFKASLTSRTAFFPSSQSAMLFVNGEAYTCSLRLARTLTQGESLSFNELDENEQNTILKLAREAVLVYAK